MGSMVTSVRGVGAITGLSGIIHRTLDPMSSKCLAKSVNVIGVAQQVLWNQAAVRKLELA